MSSEPERKSGSDSDAKRSMYESALFGEHTTSNLDYNSEMTEYGIDDSTITPSARLEDAVLKQLGPEPASTHEIPSVGRIPGLAPNHIFADHRLSRHVASGRIADVWLAFDPELQCRRAIKIMRPEIAAEPRAVENFFRSVRAQAQIKHNNVVQIVRVGRHEGLPYYIAEWVDGGTLAHWLSLEGAMPVSVAWDVIRQVLVGLSHAYAQGLMHRDLCPENILVEPLPANDGTGESRRLHVRIMNFGLSAVLDRAKDATLGSPAAVTYGSRSEYVAPEMVTGMSIDFRADVYSAGVLLYHLLVGFPPFRGNVRGEVLFKQVHDPMPAVPPMVREGLGPSGLAILKRMTEKLPAQRFPSYKELLETVFAAPVVTDRRKADREQAGHFLDAPVDRPRRARATQQKSSSKLLPGAVVALLLAALAYGFYSWKKTPKDEPEPTAPAREVAVAPALPAIQQTPAPMPPVPAATAMPAAAAPGLPAVPPGPVFSQQTPDNVGTPGMPSLKSVQGIEVTASSLPQFREGQLVLDDSSPGAIKLEPSSGWMTTAMPGSYGASSLLASVDGSLKTATFHADIPEEGEYDISLWWVPADTSLRSGKTICTIYTSTGPFRGTLDQTGPGSAGAFFPVGHYTLPAGKQIPIVAVSTEGMAASASTLVSVDALKIVKSRSATAAGSSSRAAAPAGAGTTDRVIIEAGAGGINHSQYVEVSGKWIDSRIPAHAAKSAASGLTPQGQGISRKCMFNTPGQDPAGSIPAIARFYPRFEAPGHYHVYVTWPRGGNATPVDYLVNHAGGQAKRTFSQDGYGLPAAASYADSWIDLGDYDFKGSEEEFVELQLNEGARGSQAKVSAQVYADAVCFSSTPLPDGKTIVDSATAAASPAEPVVPATGTNSGQGGIAGPLSGKAL